MNKIRNPKEMEDRKSMAIETGNISGAFLSSIL